MPEHPGLEDCETIIDSEGIVSLMAYAYDTGPYIIKIGNIPIGVFGFNMTAESRAYNDQSKELLNKHAFDIATIAFDLIQQKVNPGDDLGRIREMARAACRHAKLRFIMSRRMNEGLGGPVVVGSISARHVSG